MKFKSDIEVQAGIKDYAGSSGTAGQVLSSDGATVTWIDAEIGVASDVQNEVKAGVAINKGQAVYVTSADGTNIIVGLASNTSEATSSKTLGLLNATVAANGFADVVQIGKLTGLNTIGAVVGDPVWLGTNGNIIYGLANKPYAPAHLVYIGVVTRVSANNGEIFITVQNGFELKEIHDVDIITNVPVNGDILGYDGTLWVNKTIAEWLGYIPADDATVVHKAGAETITGTKTFLDNITYFSNNGSYSIELSNPDDLTSVLRIGASAGTSNITSDGSLGINVGGTINAIGIAPNGNTFFSNTITAPAFKTYTGTSSQFLKANGTVDSTVYVPTTRTITINGVTQSLAANQTWTVAGGIDGSGTVNTLSKFTGTTTIGDSQIKDSGTSVSIGYTTNPNTYKLDVNGDVNINTDLYVSGTFPYTIKAAGGVNVDDALGVYWKTDVGGIGGTLAGIGQSSSGLNFFTGSSFISPRMFINSSGNVGIGTTSPGGKLHVVGEGIFDDGTNGRLTFSNASSQNDIYSTTTSFGGWKNLRLSSNELILSSGGTTERMRITSGGNVGIGITTGITQKLVVDGGGTDAAPIFAKSSLLYNSKYYSGILAGYATSINQSTQFGYIYDSTNAANSIAHITAYGTAEGSQFSMRANGNVGIGITTDAGYKLDVNGSLRSSTNSVIAGTFSFINLENNSSKLNVSRYLALQDNGGAVGIGYNSDSNPVGGKLSVNGNSYFNGTITNTSNATFGLGANRPVTYDSNGGNFRIKANAGGWATGYFFDGSSGTFRGGFGAYGSANDLGYYWVGSDFNIPTMVVTPNQGGVGIGTTEPVNKLHIQNGTTANTVAMIQSWGTEVEGEHAGIRFKSAVVAANEYGKGFIAYRNAGIGYGRGDFWFCLNNDTNSLNATLSDPKMVIKSGGYVGIGTVNPARKLDIVGGHTTATFRVHYPASEVPGQDASVDIWASEPGVSYNGSGIGSNVNGHPYYGRTNPALGQGFIRFIDGTTAFHNSSTNAVNLERMRIMPGGNVLIGTTTDTGYKLEVNGNVKATGFFNSSDNRLKDLVDYEYDVSSIKPITYFWKDLRDNKKHVGYSAQEVQKVMPDAVNEGEDGMLSVNYIEVLVAKIAELENRIKQLEK